MLITVGKFLFNKFYYNIIIVEILNEIKGNKIMNIIEFKFIQNVDLVGYYGYFMVCIFNFLM